MHIMYKVWFLKIILLMLLKRQYCKKYIVYCICEYKCHIEAKNVALRKLGDTFSISDVSD